MYGAALGADTAGAADTAAASASRVAAPGSNMPAASASRYYTIEDFGHVEKIDAHVHLHGAADHFMARAIADGFRVLTIDVDYPDYPPIREQLRDAVSLRERYPGRVAFATTFSVDGFPLPEWRTSVLREIDEAVANGAV